MGKKGAIPDAWDDEDWEVQADKLAVQPEPEPEPPRRMTAAERQALHAETNRKIWESAESPEVFHFVEANTNVPLATNFKPQVKVLSRRPPPASTQTIARRRDPVSGTLSQLSLADNGDGEEDDEEGARKEKKLSPEEIRAKQQREREEKQRRYDEVRAKIFGESNPSSGASSPGAVTPPRPESRGGGYHHQNQRGTRGRGRGRGAGTARQGQYHHQQSQDEQARRPGSRPEAKELYDPNYSSKPEFHLQKRGGIGNSGGSGSGSASQSDRTWAREQDQAGTTIRAPLGPDGSGRGGFGFARRGARRD